MKLKSIVLAVGLGLAWVAGVASAQVVVIDPASIAKEIEQVQQMIQQLQVMKQQYQSLTGSYGMGQLFNNPSMSQFVPNNWQTFYQQLQNGSVQGVTSIASNIAQQDSGSIATMTSQLQQSQRQQAAVNTALAMNAYNANIARMQNIQQLLGQVDQTRNVKAATDLNSRIAAEQAMVNNESMKLQLVSMMEQAQRQRQDNQAAAIWNKELTMPDTPPSMPVLVGGAGGQQ